MQRWLLRLLLAVVTGGVALLTWLWFSLFSPWGYVPPAGLTQPTLGEAHQVFAYGTLQYPAVRWLVIGRMTPAQLATLPGFRKQGLNLVAQADVQTRGETFVVDADELRRIDRYERIGVRYQRSRVRLAPVTAWVYQRINDD